MAFKICGNSLNIGLCGIRVLLKIPLDFKARRIWFVIGEVIHRAVCNNCPNSHISIGSFGAIQHTVSLWSPHWMAQL